VFHRFDQIIQNGAGQGPINHNVGKIDDRTDVARRAHQRFGGHVNPVLHGRAQGMPVRRRVAQNCRIPPQLGQFSFKQKQRCHV